MSNEMPTELKILARNIAEYREKHRLTYQEMGEATGVDKSHIHRIENMAVFPSLKFLIRLAEYMNVPLYYLFLPSEKMTHELLAEKLTTRLTELGWTIGELEQKTGIPSLRLLDFTQGISSPTVKECKNLFTTLGFSEETDFLEVKFTLLKTLLDDFGLKEAQIDNLLSYVENNMG